MTSPLRRPGTRRCVVCAQRRPLGHFSDQVSLDHDPQRWRRIEHDACRDCRYRSAAAPGRAFR